MRIALVVGLVLVGGVVRAEVEPVSKWIEVDQKALGLKLKRPAAASVSVKGNEVTVSGGELPTITIKVESTNERSTSKSGGVRQRKVEWTIAVPKRTATCTATAANDDQANVASRVCDTIVLTAGARSPHVEIVIDAKGLADPAGFDKTVRAKQAQLDACWKTALAKDGELPEGAIRLKRTFDHGQPSSTRETAENFFDHDAKTLMSCVTGQLKAVAVKTAADDASIEVTAICHLY